MITRSITLFNSCQRLNVENVTSLLCRLRLRILTPLPSTRIDEHHPGLRPIS